MGRIKGETVILYQRTQTGADMLNAPVYMEMPVEVKNVLICPVSNEDLIQDLRLYGKRTAYELCVPKGDTHTWEDCAVEFWGQKFLVFGEPRQYMEQLVPGDWNRQVKVERYG